MATETFGRWLKRRRSGLGLTQAELAAKLGYSPDTIRKIEADEKRPSRQLALALAVALELPPDQHPAFVRFARDEGDLPDLPTQTATLPPRATLDASPSTSAPIAHNLPTPPTPLIGRQHEQAALLDRLARPDERLITLTGPGGAGKTRLALEVARTVVEGEASSVARDGPSLTSLDASPSPLHGHFPEGVYFVNLAPISDPALVASTIAQALEVREQGGRALLDSLTDYLRDKRLLLLLDNFEQVVEAAPVVADLLAYAPALKVLVTSRVPLHVRGEKEFEVPPLPLPAYRHLPPLDQLAQYAAVALFIQRAQDVKPDFQVTNANAPAVAEICHRLDGLPLAIELAAARLKALTPQALLQRLERRLGTLTGGARDLPTRQQTLRNTIAWSYDLLDDAEKTLFRRLAVFAGGRTLEAIEAICNADGKVGRASLAGVESLVSKSLLQATEGPDGETRYVMLETIHEFAHEKLAESGEAEVLARRHVEYFLALAEAAEPQLRGPDPAVWLARLEVEHANLRAALGWVIESAEGEIALRLAGALGWFWLTRGYLNEGSSWFKEILNRTVGVEAGASRAGALASAGGLARHQGDYEGALAYYHEALILFRTLQDQVGEGQVLLSLAGLAHNRGECLQAMTLAQEALTVFSELDHRDGIARSLYHLASLFYDQDDYSKASQLSEESLAWFRRLGNKHGMAWTQIQLALLRLKRDDFKGATRLLEDSLALFRELQDLGSIAAALNILGVTAWLQEDYASAFAYCTESLTLNREGGHKEGVAWSLRNLGYIEQYQGRDSDALAYFHKALFIGQQVGNKLIVAEAMVGLIAVARWQGRLEAASHWLGVVKAFLDSTHASLALADRIEYERSLQALGALLGESRLAMLLGEGQAMTLEEAVEDALLVTEEKVAQT